MDVENALKISPLSALDAEVLLAAVLEKDRSWLCAHSEYCLAEQEATLFEGYTRRRMHSEPVAYILEKQEFYGREFIVTSDVLIPRSSTEGLIDAARIFINDRNDSRKEIDTDIVALVISLGDKPITTLVDVCTGSGCIAITLALEVPEKRIIATDISAKALIIARKNAEKHKALDKIEFREGNLLEPIIKLEEPFLIVSNPPYVPDGETPMGDVYEYEPHLALFAGEEGVDLLAEIYAKAKSHPYCQGIILECRNEQVDKLLAK